MCSGSREFGKGSAPAPVVAFPGGLKIGPGSEMGETGSARLAGTIFVAFGRESAVRASTGLGV